MIWLCASNAKRELRVRCAQHLANLIYSAIREEELETPIGPKGGQSLEECIQVDTRLSALEGPVTKWINEVIGSLPASVHNRAGKHLRAGSKIEFATVLAAAEADFTAGVLFPSGPSLASTEDGAVHHEEDGLVFDELLDDDLHDACASQEPKELDVPEKDLLEIMVTAHLVKDDNVKDTAVASSSLAPIPTAGAGVPSPPSSRSAEEAATNVSAWSTALLDSSLGVW